MNFSCLIPAKFILSKIVLSDLLFMSMFDFI
nr:MAG TPA: hypothetical protein [Caudoviricetes sp.]